MICFAALSTLSEHWHYMVYSVYIILYIYIYHLYIILNMLYIYIYMKP